MMTIPKLCLTAAIFAAAIAPLSLVTDSVIAQDSGVESRTYEAIKIRDMLTFDFMLAHPEGKEPDGVTPEEAEQIEKTVKHGAERLAAAQNADGSIITHASYTHIAGSHALSVWTLLYCGRKSTDPVVVKAVEAMLRLSERRMPVPPAEPDKPAQAAMKDGVEGLYTYDVAITLLALHALAVTRQNEAEEAEAAKDREKGRAPKPPKAPVTERTAAEVKQGAAELGKRLTPPEMKIAKALLATLNKRQATDGQWTYTDAQSATGDSSNTHFAMLGLMAAFKIGLGAPSGFQLDRTERFLLASQQASGPEVTLTFRDTVGPAPAEKHKTSSKAKPREVKTQARSWKYVIGVLSQTKSDPASDATLSMGAAGVVVLSCVRYLRVEGAGTAIGMRSVSKLDPGMHSALAWMSATLDKRFGTPKAGEKESAEEAKARKARANALAYPGGTHWNAYTLLAVERAGILTGCDFFGACEWYPVGARALLTRLADCQSPIPDAGEGDGGEAGAKPAKPTDVKRVAGRAMDSDFCLNLLFLKGYLDKAPKKKPGPIVTGKDREKDDSGE